MVKHFREQATILKLHTYKKRENNYAYFSTSRFKFKNSVHFSKKNLLKINIESD